MKYKWIVLFVLLVVTPLVFSQSPQHGMTLTWTEGATVAGFNVYRSTVSGSGYAKLNAALIPSGTLTYFDPTGTGGTTYYYVITAVDSLGVESVYSNQVTGVAIANPPAPALQGVEK